MSYKTTPLQSDLLTSGFEHVRRIKTESRLIGYGDNLEAWLVFTVLNDITVDSLGEFELQWEDCNGTN